MLIIGPPGAGKTTLAEQLADQGYLHLEREQFNSEADFRAAVQRSAGTDLLAVVRTCATPRDRREWARLMGATRVEVVDPGLDECKRRIFERGRKSWRGEISSAERWYRPSPNRAPRRRTSRRRNYGRAHQRARAGVKPFVDAGVTSCARCGRPIVPGEEWHLGHDDETGGYSGPEHALCNTSAGGKLGHARSNQGRRTSRLW